MEEIVHIVPLANEIDRAVKPFEKLRANRVYLLYTRQKTSEKNNPNPDSILNTVRERLVHFGIEVIAKESEMEDPLPMLSTISNIIIEEQRKNNLVYVNMSSAGKLTAVAATLAAMYHDVKVYYVRSSGEYSQGEKEIKEHGLSIINDPELVMLTNFKIDIPSGAKSTFLVELNVRRTMTTKNIIKMIRENRLKGFEDLNEGTRSASNLLVRINRGILDELEVNGYITVEKKGRSKMITITDKGRYAACLIGDV